MSDMNGLAGYIEPLLARPYKTGARGPDAFDCWGLTKQIQRVLFGRELAEVDTNTTSTLALVRLIKAYPEHDRWRRVERPVHGGVVELSEGQHPHHIGTYLAIDGGGILHCAAGCGVTFDRVQTMKIAGWRGFRWYEWVGANGLSANAAQKVSLSSQ